MKRSSYWTNGSQLRLGVFFYLFLINLKIVYFIFVICLNFFNVGKSFFL